MWWWLLPGLAALYLLGATLPTVLVAGCRRRLVRGLPPVESREALAALKAEIAAECTRWAGRAPSVPSAETVAVLNSTLRMLRQAPDRLCTARDVLAFYLPEPITLSAVARWRVWAVWRECVTVQHAIRDYRQSQEEIARAQGILAEIESGLLAREASTTAIPETSVVQGLPATAAPSPSASGVAALTQAEGSGRPVPVPSALSATPAGEAQRDMSVPRPPLPTYPLPGPRQAADPGRADPSRAAEVDTRSRVQAAAPVREPEEAARGQASAAISEAMGPGSVPPSSADAEEIARRPARPSGVLEPASAAEPLRDALPGHADVRPQEAAPPESRRERAAALYAEALRGLQIGDWSAANNALEELGRLDPEDARVQPLLEEVQFKAQRDKGRRVRAKGRVFPWRRIGFVVALIGVVIGIALLAGRLFVNQLQPAVAQAKAVRQQEQLYAEAMGLLEADDLESAEARLNLLLQQVPDHARAQEGLRLLEERRGIRTLYERAVEAEEAGDLSQALQMYTDVTMRLRGYRDVTQRIGAVKRQMRLEELFQQAEAAYAAGDLAEALRRYNELSSLSAGFRPSDVQERVFDLNARLGVQIVEHDPPMPERIEEARAYFAAALAIKPSDSQVALEHRLASNYLEGMALLQRGDLDGAVTALRAVYNQRAGYLGGVLVETLYEAYVRSGDQHRDAGDMGFAYEQYRRAAVLPLADVALALERLQSVSPNLTPTPTPTATPTPTNTPRPTGTRRPTVAPTPRPLRAYHDYIVFVSEEENQPGYWVMRPDGTDRQYIGRSTALRQEFDALYESQHYSPDGRYKVYTGAQSQLFIALPPGETYRGEAWRQLTYMSNVCYDAVWSPDGGRIAFVSENSGSDDIWVINADGKNGRNLTPNAWEWEKHPSWSPDSRRIVFWSNRDGHMQIYVMYADGSGVLNISNTRWSERDPIWIP